jgi:uncharacterized protein YcfL
MKKNIMKKVLFFVFIVSFLAFGCKNSSDNSIENDDNSEVVDDNDDIDIEDVEEIQRVELTYIPAIMEEQSDEIKQKFNLYFDAFNSEITSEKQLMAILDMRDSLIWDMVTVFEEYYYKNEEDYDTWSLIDIELDTIGFWTIYAEGMFMNLGEASILEEEIEKFASEEFKLYLNFKNEYSMAMGGEYPYMSLFEYFDALKVGEKMYKEYPNSKYFDLIFEDYYNCLNIVTDIHVVNNEACFYSDFNDSFWPFATSCEDWAVLIEENPNSMFTPILQNLSDNTSSINIDYDVNEGEAMSIIYVVATDKVVDAEAAKFKIYDYLHQGLDIVHALTFENNGKTEHYVAYRFYSEDYKSKAEESFEYIKSIAPNAQLIKVKHYEEFANPIVLEITD